jgi:peptide-methionine (S)-S-oxide reductase
MTGHNEVVRVVYEPAIVTYNQLLKVFWEAHDPTQGMRQGNDVGTQYRSVIYTFTRSLSDLGDRSEHGGRTRTDFHDFEAHSHSTQRGIEEIWAALPSAQ